MKDRHTGALMLAALAVVLVCMGHADYAFSASMTACIVFACGRG